MGHIPLGILASQVSPVVINGIIVELQVKNSVALGGRVDVELWNDTDGSYTATQTGDTISSTGDNNKVYGSSSELWDTTWTAADISAIKARVHLEGRSTGNPAVTSIDYVRITVHYDGDQSTAATYPTVASEVDNTGSNWGSDKDNIFADDGSYAATPHEVEANSDYLIGETFGITL